MIDLEKVFKFLSKNDITFEEMGLLLTIYYKNTSEDINKASNVYYRKENVLTYRDRGGEIVPILWESLFTDLIRKGLIENIRPNSKNKEEVKNYRVTDKFTNLYFVKKDSAYEYALALYPSFLEVKNTKVSTKTVDHVRYSNIFYQKVIKNGDKEAFDFFVYMTKELFDYTEQYDDDGRTIGGEPRNLANTKWDKYLDSFDDLAREFKANGSISNNSWNNFC